MKLIYRKLKAEDRKNFRNVRAAALMFIVLGGLIAFSGLSLFFAESKPQSPLPPKIVLLLMFAVGLAGVVGGIAIRKANAKWSNLIYGMACVYVLAFPVGTVLSLVIFQGLKKYLKDVQQVRDQLRERAAD